MQQSRFWVVIEPKHKEILAADILKERNMFVAERFLSQAVNKYGMLCCMIPIIDDFTICFV